LTTILFRLNEKQEDLDREKERLEMEKSVFYRTKGLSNKYNIKCPYQVMKSMDMGQIENYFHKIASKKLMIKAIVKIQAAFR
jgi:hypothetical protein